jgi:uncharacterized protein DUF6636
VLRSPLTRLALAAAVAVGILAGCGSDETKTVTRDEADRAPTTQRTSPPERTGTEPSTTPSRTAPSGTTTHLEQFRTPTGNIGCGLVGGSARCDIRGRDWSPPPKPSSCELDWGQGIGVGEGGAARFVCAGDTALDPSAPVLAYGETSRVGAVSCTSQEAGITCRSDTGHGFFLSRQRFELF